MNSTSKSLIIALGASLSVVTNVIASTPINLFQAEKLARGYKNSPNTMKLTSNSNSQSNPSMSNTDGTEIKPTQGKCGAGKCSSDKKATGKCGAGKCGVNKVNKAEGKVEPTESKEQ